MDKTHLKIFIGYTEVAGFYSALARELREGGADVKYVGGNNHKFAYSSEKQNLLDRVFYFTLRRDIFFLKLFYLILRELVSIFYGVQIAARYDIFVVGYNRPCSVLGLDLLIARLCGVLVVTFGHHGSESRPPLLSAANETKSDLLIAIFTLKSYYFCRVTALLSNYCVTNPLYDHFYKRGSQNIFYLAFGVPANTHFRKKPIELDKNNNLILHIPSASNLKGTDEIKSIFTDEIKILEKLTHEEVLNEFMNSTLIIDQLYSDNPFPATTRENLILNNQILISGYDLDKLVPLATIHGYEMRHICTPDLLRYRANQVLAGDLSISEDGLNQRRALHSFKKLMCNSDQKTLMYNVGDYRSYRGVGYKTHKLESKINKSTVSKVLTQICTL